MKVSISIFLLAIFWFTSKGQEVNYKVVSESITCDQLPTSFKNKDQALELISDSKFRYQQNFRIRRKAGLKAGDYYSCDNQKGFLIIQIDDEFEIYRDVIKTDWEVLISSNDPEQLLKSLFTIKYVKL